jgi:hypothetical protein
LKTRTESKRKKQHDNKRAGARAVGEASSRCNPQPALRHVPEIILRGRGQVTRLREQVGEMRKTEDFYKQSMTRVAAEFGITSPLQMIARAENNEQTYADILIKIIREQLAAIAQQKEKDK